MMRKLLCNARFLFLSMVSLAVSAGSIPAYASNPDAENKKPVMAYWSFDNDETGTALNSATGNKDQISGKYEYRQGVVGKALSFDGFRTYIKTKRVDHLNLAQAFTIEAWIAPAMYPWAKAPIYDCSDGGAVRGFIFSIDDLGHVCFKVGVRSSWREIMTMKTIPLRKWSHIAGVFQADDEIAIYIDGEKAASTKIEGLYTEALFHVGATIGRSARTVDWKENQMSSPDTKFFIDGLVDEIKLSGYAKSESELKAYVGAQTLSEPSLTDRSTFPRGERGNGSFGAFYSRLDYYKEWDDLWRVGEKPDVFVRFEDSPVQFIFWRGTSFVPCWVSENNIWCTNEWLETWGGDVNSCAEPLMDRQARHSHVRIIENTDARVVIHWRYALVDALYNFVAISDDGRGEWCDEYHIIYPDQVGIRRMELHYSKPERNHDWIEQIILTAPGQYPQDLIEEASITLKNMKDESKDYVWDDKLEIKMEEPQKANISWVNLKAEYCPFFVLPDDPVNTVEGKWDSPFFRSYAAKNAMGGYRPNPAPTPYGWWNHWPVAQIPGDGRWIVTPDKPGHFNLTTFVQWNDLSKTDKTRTRIMLQGMTNKKEDLVKIARSWLEAPAMNIVSSGFTGGGYDEAERAYVIEKTGRKSGLEATIKASAEAPLVNPAFIVKNWGGQKAEVTINGKTVTGKDTVKQGIRKGINGDDLILWIKMDKKSEVRISLK